MKAWIDDEAFLRGILGNAPSYIMVFDRQGRFRFINRVDPPRRQTDVIGKSVLTFIAPRLRAGFRAGFLAALRGRVVTVRTFSAGPDATWWENTMGPLRRNGRIVAVIGMAQRITERVRLEQAENDLKRLRERFENVFNHSSDGMSVTTMDGRFLSVNPAYCRITGYSRRELVNRKRFLDITAPEHRATDRGRMRQMTRTGEPMVFEKAYIRKDGSRVPVLITVFPLKDADGKIAGFGTIVRDITERRQAQQQIDEAASREQSRLGRDLHDGIGQYLTGISLLARSLQSRLAGLGLSGESREAGRITVAANAAVTQTRALAQGLIPTELSGGLKGALAALAENSRALFGVSVSVACPDRLAVKDQKAALNLYRIAQEAVHNACRHGKAERVSIRVSTGAKGAVTLRVADDGAGLPSRLRPGLGLRTMSHRAQLLGGTIEVSPRARRGAVVVCRCQAV